MVQQAHVDITVAGASIMSRLGSRLLSLQITDQEGTHADTASIEIDDTGGKVLLPSDGQPIAITLGWRGGGAAVVFIGTVDEVKSVGDRNGGRKLTISAKGLDTKGKAKQPQQKHVDNKKASEFLGELGKEAGITVQVDPALDQMREWWGANDESFIHAGERLARELGGIFKVQGNRAIIADKTGASISGAALSVVTARYGDNLINWNLAPRVGRPQFKEILSRWYDPAKAKWITEKAPVKGADVEATYSDRFSRLDKDQSKKSGDNTAKDSEREKGGGSVTINGTGSARPGGTCIVAGARPGIDGAYRIEQVTHTLTRSGGWTTALTLKMPGSDTGSDNRAQ